MAQLFRLLARDSEQASAGLAGSTVALLVVLICLLLAILFFLGTLFYLRRRKRIRREQELPYYHEKRASMSSTASTHRRIMTRPSEPAYVSQEKEALMRETSHPPDSPLPEIRITLPEEYDASGKRQSGRVMIVRMGEHGEGLEPVEDGMLVYQEKDGERFQSLDLERIGGLIEKARNSPNTL